MDAGPADKGGWPCYTILYEGRSTGVLEKIAGGNGLTYRDSKHINGCLEERRWLGRKLREELPRGTRKLLEVKDLFSLHRGGGFKVIHMSQLIELYTSITCVFLYVSIANKAIKKDFPSGAVVKNPPMQGTRVWALVREDATCCRATKPVRHNYWACALKPASHNYWARVPQLLSPCATTTEPVL